MVAPHPGIAPKKAPTNGWAHLGPYWLSKLLCLFFAYNVNSANPIIEIET